MRIEPKTFFANERTFLSWLHMAVTIGSIAAALLGFVGVADSSKHKQEARLSFTQFALPLALSEAPQVVALLGDVLWLQRLSPEAVPSYSMRALLA